MTDDELLKIDLFSFHFLSFFFFLLSFFLLKKNFIKKKILSDLFQKLRQKEPTRIFIFRCFVIIVSLILLIAIFVILCIEIRDELPSIKTTPRKVNSLPAPGEKYIYIYFFSS